MRNSAERRSDAPGRCLILRLHPRIACFLKTGTSGLSGKLPAFYHALLCFHTGNSLIPRNPRLASPSAQTNNGAAPNFSPKELILLPAMCCCAHIYLCTSRLCWREQDFTKAQSLEAEAGKRLCPGAPLLSLWFHRPTSPFFLLSKLFS